MRGTISKFSRCTIEPNVGTITVPDALEAGGLVSPSGHATTIEIVDVAGLVKGAHKGED